MGQFALFAGMAGRDGDAFAAVGAGEFHSVSVAGDDEGAAAFAFALFAGVVVFCRHCFAAYRAFKRNSHRMVRLLRVKHRPSNGLCQIVVRCFNGITIAYSVGNGKEELGKYSRNVDKKNASGIRHPLSVISFSPWVQSNLPHRAAGWVCERIPRFFASRGALPFEGVAKDYVKLW